MVTALIDLEIKLGDISNAFIQIPVTGKVWTTLGHEFGKVDNKIAVIVRAA